jgi:hypothetical protein
MLRTWFIFHLIRNVDVRLAALSCRSKRRCWARCTFVLFEMSTLGSVHITSTFCTFVSFETSGSLVFLLFVMRVLGFVGARFSTPSCHSTCEFLLPMFRHGGLELSTLLRRPIPGVWALLMFLRDVGPVLVPETSGEWW